MSFLTTHKGMLFGGVGYWQDDPGSDPSPGPQILVKPSATSAWKVEKSFGARYYSIEALSSVKFVTDGAGKRLPTPVTLLLAGPAPASQPNEGSIWSRDEPSGEWTKMVLVPNSTADRPENVRTIFTHIDSVTGVQSVYAGMTRAGVFRGVYDAGVPGQLRWESTPELPPTSERVLCAAESNGVLYAAAGSNNDPTDGNGGLYRRTDGADPHWDVVYEWPITNRNKGTGLRGLTSVPAPTGDHDVLLAGFEQAGTMLSIDPTRNFEATVDFDFKASFTNLWGSLGGAATIAAYNDIPKVADPITGKPFWLIGLWVNHPDSTTPPNNGSYYLVRSDSRTYEIGNVYDPLMPVPAGDELKGNRAIVASPFPEDQGRVIFMGGYDAGGAQKRHNTAWVYRGVLR